MTYRCEDGFSPSSLRKSVCKKGKSMFDFGWKPALRKLTCTSIKLEVHERKNSSSKLSCPWDTISYKCFVNSTDPNMFLTWEITALSLGGMTQSVLYNKNSTHPSKTQLPMDISITLDILTDAYMESTIKFTQLPGINLREFFIVCKTVNIEEATYVDSEIPLGIILCTITTTTTTTTTTTIIIIIIIVVVVIVIIMHSVLY